MTSDALPPAKPVDFVPAGTLRVAELVGDLRLLAAALA